MLQFDNHFLETCVQGGEKRSRSGKGANIRLFEVCQYQLLIIT